MKRRVGGLLVALAAVLAMVGFVLLGRANDKAATDAHVAELTVALGGRAELDPEPNRTPATTAWVLAGAAFLAGVMLIAVPPDSTPDEDAPAVPY